MDIGQELLTAILAIVVPALVSIVIGITVAIARAGYLYLVNKLPSSVQADVNGILSMAVQAAEQAFKNSTGSNTGVLKKEYAKHMIQDYLSSKRNLTGRSIQLPDSVLDGMIETAVKQLTDAGKSITKPAVTEQASTTVPATVMGFSNKH